MLNSKYLFANCYRITNNINNNKLSTFFFIHRYLLRLPYTYNEDE